MSNVLAGIGLTGPTATLLAAGVGFVGGLLSSLVPVWIRRRRRRRSFRRALCRELTIPGPVIEEMTEADPSADGPFHTEIPMTVYESQASDLGLLSEDEIDAVIAYYSTARVAKQQLQSVDDDAVAQRLFNETVPLLDRHRTDALSEIKSRL